MATMTHPDGYWILSTTATGADTKTVTLATENKFVDQNIVVKFTTPAAATPSLAITDLTNAVTVGTASGGYYTLTNSNVTGTITFGVPGWAGSTSAIDSSVKVGKIAQSYMKVGSTTAASGTLIVPAVNTDQTITIAAGYEGLRTLVVKGMTSGTTATAHVTGTRTAATPTLANLPTNVSGKSPITATPVTNTTGITKYYMSVQVNAPVTEFSSTHFTKVIDTSGFLNNIDQITIADKAIKTSAANQTYYLPLTSGAASVIVSSVAATPIATTATGSLTGKISVTATPVTAASGIDTYYIPFRVSVPTTSEVPSNLISTTVTTAGYIDATTTIPVSASIAASTATYYMPLTSGHLTGGEGSVSGSGTSGGVTMTEVTSPPSLTNYYYITMTGSGIGTVDVTGWIPADTTASSSIATKYARLNKAQLTQSGSTINVSEGYVSSSGLQLTLQNSGISVGTEDKSLSSIPAANRYTPNTTAVVPANGYLYIGAGYYPNTQISLATLIPDDGDYTNAGEINIRTGFEAYDTNGNKLIGTMPEYNGTYTLT